MDISVKSLAVLILSMSFGTAVIIGAAMNFGPEQADTTGDSDMTFDGEFERHGLSAGYEAPFSNTNVFTPTEDASPNSNDVLDAGSYTWTTSNGTDLVTERSAVTYFETDGAMEDLEMDIAEVDSVSDVTIDSVTFYDYEAAVDENDLEAGENAVSQPQDVETDGVTAELDNFGSVQEGEYAVEVEYRFDGYTTPADTATDTIGEWAVEADTDGDVDHIKNIPIEITGSNN